MANFPLVVSYYTKDTLYQLEVQNLIASCEQWQLEHHVEPIASFGSWERNCAFKPFFLFKMLEQFNRPIFWVDADAVFKKAPQHLDVFAHDFAVRINHDFEDSHPSKVISGSLYVNATEGAKRILKSWAKECLDSLSDAQRTVEVWDQIALRDVLARGVSGATYGSLPHGYMAIMGNALDEKQIPDITISHYQASRRFKKTINN